MKNEKKISVWKIIKRIVLTVLAIPIIIIAYVLIKASPFFYYYYLGDEFLKKGNYDLALKNYEKAYNIAPDEYEQNQIIKEIKYVNEVKQQNGENQINSTQQNEENQIVLMQKKMVEELETFRITQQPPQLLFNLIVNTGNLQPDSITKTCEILSILWQNPEARKLLTMLINYKIPIYITPGEQKSGASTQVSVYANRYTAEKKYVLDIKLEIGEKVLESYKNRNNSSYMASVEPIAIVCHELCHIMRNVVNHDMKNSLEEELSAIMIGMNITNKVLLGRELNTEETEYYSKMFLYEMSFNAAAYGKLQVYSGFNNFIESYGIYPPHPDIYQNIPEVYKKIRDNPNTTKFDNLEQML